MDQMIKTDKFFLNFRVQPFGTAAAFLTRRRLSPCLTPAEPRHQHLDAPFTPKRPVVRLAFVGRDVLSHRVPTAIFNGELIKSGLEIRR